MAKKKKSKPNKIFRQIFYGLIMSIIITAITFLGGSFFVWSGNRDKVDEALQKFSNEVNISGNSYGRDELTKPIKIYDKNRELIGEFYKKNYKPIRVDNLENHSTLVWALLASEDRNFYEHMGVDYRALIRAIYVNLTSKRFVQGGSTITQQLAKLSLNLGERNIFNKITETFCAYYIELNYTKDTILTMYMNQIFLGEGNIGLEAASQYYFGKSAYSLNPAEAALLVGIIPAPSVYNPVKNLNISLERQNMVLSAMVQNVNLYSGKEKYGENFNEAKIKSELKKFKTTYSIELKGKVKQKSKIGTFGYDRDFRINHAPEFNEMIRSHIMNNYPTDFLEANDFSIYTTLDIKKQRLAQSFIQEGVEGVKNELRKRFDKKKNKSEDDIQKEKEILDGMNGALVSINPHNGDVEAYVGAIKLNSVYRLNRVEDIKRQPGSAIKGLVYAIALEKKIINPSSIVTDEKIDYGGYSPKNWYSGYKGMMTARESLGLSVNTVSVKLLKEIGLSSYLEKLGEILNISKSDVKDRMGSNLSLALGTGELSPWELAKVYTIIASGGLKIEPIKIHQIKFENTGDTETNYTNQAEDIPIVIDPIASAMTINMMEAVLSELGTMQIKTKKGGGFPMAGKTGTTQIPSSVRKKWGNREGVRDVWFAGITPSLVTVVWIGNDAGAPFPGTGAGTAGPVWRNYVTALNKASPFEGDIVPHEIVTSNRDDYLRLDICGETGELLEKSAVCKYPLLAQYYYKDFSPKFSEVELDFLHEKQPDVPLEEEPQDGYLQEADPSTEEEEE